MKKKTVHRKDRCGCVLAILMTLFCSSSVHAEAGQWIGPIDPGGGGQVVDIEVDPRDHEHVFALINSGGVRRSRDGGLTWTVHNLGLEYEAQGYKASQGRALGLHPEEPHVLLRCSSGSEIYLSTDGGDSWEPSYAMDQPEKGNAFFDFTYDPGNPDVVYTAFGGNNHITVRNYDDKTCTNNRILRGEYDRAAKRYQWRIVMEEMGSLEDKWVYSMDVTHQGDRTYLYLTAPYGLYKGELTRNGDQLTIERLEPLHGPSGPAGLPESQFLEGCKVVVDDHAPGRIYLTVGNKANQHGGVYRSNDYGATFALLTDPNGYDPLDLGQYNTRFFQFAVSPSNRLVLYASMVRYTVSGERRNGTLMRSNDGGANWHPMMVFDGMHMGWKDHRERPDLFSVNRIAPSSDASVFYASTGHGSHLYRSDNASDRDPEWTVKSTTSGSDEFLSGGFPAIAFQWSIAVNPFDPSMIIVPYGDHGIFVSEDGGQSMSLRVKHGHNNLGETFGGTIVVDEKDPSVWYYALHGPHMKLTGFSAGGRPVSGAVMKFVDYGSSWSYLGGGRNGNDQGFPRGPAFGLLIEYGENGDRTVYATNYNRPVDNGGVYQKTGDGDFKMIFKKARSRVIAQRDNFSRLYLGADKKGLYRLKRTGESTWTRKRLCYAGVWPCGNQFYAMKTGHESGNIYCATDIGLILIDRNDQVIMLREGAHYWDVAINSHYEDILYLVSDHGEGVLRSMDRGLTWSNVSEGLPTLNTMRLAVDPAADTIYVGTKSAGIWKRSF